jgi:hypothetical protein
LYQLWRNQTFLFFLNGTAVTLTDKWKAGLHAELMQYVEGVSQTSYELGGRLRLSLDNDSAVLLELAENREFSSSFVKAQFS